MTIINVKNPQWSDAEHTGIDVVVNTVIDSVPVTIPFHAKADDVEEHGKKIFLAAVAGEYGEISPVYWSDCCTNYVAEYAT